MSVAALAEPSFSLLRRRLPFNLPFCRSPAFFVLFLVSAIVPALRLVVQVAVALPPRCRSRLAFWPVGAASESAADSAAVHSDSAAALPSARRRCFRPAMASDKARRRPPPACLPAAAASRPDSLTHAHTHTHRAPDGHGNTAQSPAGGPPLIVTVSTIQPAGDSPICTVVTRSKVGRPSTPRRRLAGGGGGGSGDGSR